MASGPPGVDVERKRRPKDRKKQIADNASELFVRNGFHAVRMEDIAAMTDITVRALYRHYAHKKALLSHVVTEGQGRYLAALTAPASEAPGLAPHQLEGLLQRLVPAALDTRHLALLWQREARYLDADDYQGVRRRLAGIAGEIAAAIHSCLPAVPPSTAEIRAWAILGILASPGHHQLAVPRADFESFLLSACRSAVSVPVATSAHRAGSPDAAGHRPVRMLSSRREELLRSAARAFRRHGYPAVSIDEIGAQQGIAGPALYRYFESKADILVTLVGRVEEWFTLDSVRALRYADDDAAALRGLVAGYVGVALEAPDLVSVSVTESLHLPDAAAERLQRLRHDRGTEWARWVSKERPALSEAAVRLRVNTAMSLVDDTVRVPSVLDHAELADELTKIALFVLFLPSAEPSIR